MKILRISSPFFAFLCIILLSPGTGLAVWKPNRNKQLQSSRYMTVRTTAYTHTESDHLVYGRKNALDSSLRLSRNYTSAASDWSRFPVGTKFRIKGGNRTYVIDDYGSALVGTDTIDIYHPSKKAMNQWGVRYVEIEILKWGDYERSRQILQERKGYSHVRKMLAGIDSRKRRLSPFNLNQKRSATQPVDLPVAAKSRPAATIDQRKVTPLPFASAKPIPIATPVNPPGPAARLIATPVSLPPAHQEEQNSLTDNQRIAAPKTPTFSREKMASTRQRNFRPMTRTMSVAIVETVSPAGKAAVAPKKRPAKTSPPKRKTRAFRPLIPGSYTGCK